MVFSSISFIFLFLSAVIIVYYVLPKCCRNTVLFLSSLVFYFVGEQFLTLIMLASALCDYLCSLGIEHFAGNKAIKKLFFCISLVFNLGLLAYFKYADLFVNSFNSITGATVPLLQVALPIGISFYTFQTMSYTIDVYRGDVTAERNFIDYAAYVTLFPQLVAGPIVRYQTISEELKTRKTTVEGFSYGICRFCVGLGKKVLIANTLAELVSIYESSVSPTLLLAWLSAFAVPLQIYFDFSGYSDMAIGLGAMFGFTFPENFDHPLISRSATEFWRRWHMTLGTWFRDYLYIPLGGNRCNPARHILNLLIVWCATGLWHGAEYNFILWGLYYGILLILEKYVYGKLLEKHNILSHIYFVLITIIGFEIFNASSLTDITTRFRQLIGVSVSALADSTSIYHAKGYAVVLLYAVILSTPIIPWIKKKSESSDKIPSFIPQLTGYVICLALLVISVGYLVDGSYNPFLYFRF